MDDLQKLVGEWSAQKISAGKSFDDLFQIEGIPLWWFYKRFFVQNVLPGPVNTFEQCKKNDKLTKFQKTKLRLNSILLRHYSFFQEKRKIAYFRCFNRRLKQKKDTNKILFLSYSNHRTSEGKIFRLQNLIEKIKKDRRIEELVLFADPLSSRKYKNIPLGQGIYSYYDQNISSKARKSAQILHKKWKALGKKAKRSMLTINNEGNYNLERSVRINKINNNNDNRIISLWPYLQYAFDFFFSKQFLYLTSLYYEMFKKIISEEKAKAIVLTSNNSLFDKCAIAAAAKSDIPIFILQHGIGGFIFHPDPVGKTTFFVFNPLYKKRLLDHGVNEKAIKITGPIIFDDVYKFKKALSRNKQKTKIFIATSPLIEGALLTKKRYFKYLAKILSDLQKIKNVSAVVKLHPQEKTFSDYCNLVKKEAYTNVTIIRNHDRNLYYRLLSECDVFIHFNSSASLEALMLAKPVIDISLPEQEKESHFTKGSGATVEISLHDSASKAVLKALQKDTTRGRRATKLIQHFCGKVDGKAYERAAKAIYEHISLTP